MKNSSFASRNNLEEVGKPALQDFRNSLPPRVPTAEDKDKLMAKNRPPLNATVVVRADIEKPEDELLSTRRLIKKKVKVKRKKKKDPRNSSLPLVRMQDHQESRILEEN